MGLKFYYEVYEAGVLASINQLGDDVVRFADVSFAESAEVGEAAVSGIRFDDPAGDLDIVGWRIFYAKETAVSSSSNQFVFYGRMMDRSYARGGSDRSSLRLDTARVIDVDLVDDNVLLGARIVTGTDGNRPAETAGARLTWLLGTSYVVFGDHGHVTYPSDPMDACDYRGQTAKDVIADCAMPGGYNFWVAIDQDAGGSELFFLHPDSNNYDSPLRLSNDLADYDGTRTFAPAEDATLKRSPSRIAYGVYLPFSGGSVYRTNSDTGYYYAFIDRSAPMANVKSEAKANTIADRFLADNDEEDDRVTVSVELPAANVNDIRAGHLLSVKFTHLPGYEDFRWTRVLHRTVQQIDTANYRLGLELSPASLAAAPAPGETTFAILYEPTNNGVTNDPITFRSTGDAPGAGYAQNPLIGPVSYVQDVAHPTQWSGLEVAGDGTVDLVFRTSFSGSIIGTARMVAEILVAGSTVASDTWVDSNTSGFPHSIIRQGWEISASNIAVTSGQKITVRMTATGITSGGFVVPAGTDQNIYLSLSGSLAP